MKKRLIALLLVLVLLVPAGIASAATWYRVNTSSLRVRYLPSESARTIGSYRRDYAATIGSTKDGWSYVTFSNGVQGYVQSKYLAKGSSYKAWVYSDNTSLRRGPDGNFGAVATLARGTQVTVLTHGSKYDYVSAGSFGNGYIRNSLLSRKKIKASGAESKSTAATGGNYNAWVNIAGYRTVNLYNSASDSAPVIASYGSGTQVYVVSHGSEWDNVTVDGNTGWMKTRFLVTSAPAPTAAPDSGEGKTGSYTAYVVSANKKPVHVRGGASKNYSVKFDAPYGAAVTVLEHGKNWDYIQYNGKKGYMDNSFLRLQKPSDAADPVVTETPAPFQPYYTTIYTENGKPVNCHKGMGDGYSNTCVIDNGMTVYVLEINGRWAHVECERGSGWIWKQFLK